MDLFDFHKTYPKEPGSKGRRGTSEAAAKDMAAKASTLRDQCLEVLKEYAASGLTADQIAKALHKDVLSIRPRISELAAMGLIEDTGRRGKNRSSKSAVIWQAR